MTGVGEPSAADAPTLLTQATEAVQKATEAVQTTSRGIADAVRRVAGPVLPPIVWRACRAKRPFSPS
jgi:hypothetical protein